MNDSPINATQMQDRVARLNSQQNRRQSADERNADAHGSFADALDGALGPESRRARQRREDNPDNALSVQQPDPNQARSPDAEPVPEQEADNNAEARPANAARRQPAPGAAEMAQTQAGGRAQDDRKAGVDSDGDSAVTRQDSSPASSVTDLVAGMSAALQRGNRAGAGGDTLGFAAAQAALDVASTTDAVAGGAAKGEGATTRVGEAGAGAHDGIADRTELDAGDRLPGDPAGDATTADASWAETLDQIQHQVSYWMGKGVKQAQLQVRLGSERALDVSVSLDKKGAALHFATDHAVARQAIETGATDLLRQALAREGIDLLGVSVGQQNAGQGERGFDGGASAGGRGPALGRSGDAAGAPAEAPTRLRSPSNSVLDLYA